MEVVIESKTSGSFTIDLGSSDTILKVKEKVAKHTLIPIHLQTLVFNGQTLSDDLDTAHYGIVRGSRVLLLYDHPGSRTDIPGLTSADRFVRDVGVHCMNTQPLEKLPVFGRTYSSSFSFDDMSDYMTVGDVGSDDADLPMMMQKFSSGEFINPFYTPTGFTDNVAGGSVNPPPKTSTGGHYYYPYIPKDVLAENDSKGNVGGTANPQQMTSTGGYKSDPSDPSSAFTDKPISDVGGGTMNPPSIFTSTGGFYVDSFSGPSTVGDSAMMPLQPPKTTTAYTGPSTFLAPEKRKGNGGGSALTPPRPQRLKTTTGAPSKAIPDKLPPKDKVIGGDAAMKPPTKMTVMMKPKSPAGAKGVPVEVYSGEKVSMLRKELEQLKAEKKMKLPDQYYFIHKQNPLYEEDLTFFATGVTPGDTIDIFPGSISDPPN